MVRGKLLCRIGGHEYEEVRSELLHGGEDKVIHLLCTRKDCLNPKAWTEWRRDDSGEYKQVL